MLTIGAMKKVRVGGEKIRKFIISNVQRHPSDIPAVTAARFDITRQAVNLHIRNLIEGGAITAEGSTRARVYKLAELQRWSATHMLAEGLAESEIWNAEVRPLLQTLPDNVIDLWHYGFTELFNNVIDHSDAESVRVALSRTAATTEMNITDDGVGIFRKIQRALNLADERHAVLELAKGKFTTDPSKHSGEGIFFSSRMFDQFNILSGGVYFSHEFDDEEDWIIEPRAPASGTLVQMSLNNHTSRTQKKVFDKFSVGEDYAFSRTVVPVRLTQYGDDKLVSRSQARRLLARIDRFTIVLFDFKGVESIGQAFADEVFRVFPLEHPDIAISDMNSNSAVKQMIARARTA